MPRLLSALAPFRSRLALVAGVLVTGLAVWFALPLFRTPNPLLETPTLVLNAVQARSLYFNAAARPWLLAQRPDLVTAEDRDDGSQRTRTFAQAVLVPRLFRQLDRRDRFDALLFIGDPSQYRPLLDHLVETKDWSLSYVDHLGMIFRRDVARPWKPEDFQPVRAHFASASAHDRAVFLAQTATKLVAVREFTSAKQLLDEAVQLDARLPDAWNGLATYHMHRGEYREAYASAERAIALDKAHLPALATKTQLLFATRNYSEAYELSKQLIARLPDDPNLLFYHAKIAHEAHAYKAEIEALERLITRAKADQRPVSGYQLYLAQAYTAASDGPRAIEAFMQVLNDPDLPQDQRDFARENIARIKKRTGL